MSTKAKGDSCYEKAAPDEPIFVLRGQDKLAPTAVRIWAQLALKAGMSKEKFREAEQCALEMEKWHTRKIPD